jgi:hypothetical protein
MEQTTRAFSVGLTVVACLLFISATAPAELIYFDNFEQFPNGATLTPTNYVPVSGPSGASATFINSGTPGFPQPTITASNFLGSTRALFNFTWSGDSLYTCTLATPQTNQILVETWTLWASGHGSDLPSGFDIMLPMTNGAMQSLLEFSDGGQLYALNTNSILHDYSFIGIGNWQSLAGTLITNQLIVNYPANTFSFSLNGVLLANLPLSGLFTDLVGQTRFDASEVYPPTSRQFALDDVMVEAMQVPEPASLGMVILGMFILLVNRQLRPKPS